VTLPTNKERTMSETKSMMYFNKTCYVDYVELYEGHITLIHI